jgi:hypothetical protein
MDEEKEGKGRVKRGKRMSKQERKDKLTGGKGCVQRRKCKSKEKGKDRVKR